MFAVMAATTGCDGACEADCIDGEDVGNVKPWAQVGGASDTGKGFVDWTDGEATPPMIRGPQGGQHVWVTVRMRGLSPKKLRMTVEMSRKDNGKIVKPGAVPVMSTVKTSPEFPSGFQSNYITAFVRCPCQVANKPLRVHLAVADLYGRTFETDATITPTWDGDCSLPPSSSCAEQ